MRLVVCRVMFVLLGLMQLAGRPLAQQSSPSTNQKKHPPAPAATPRKLSQAEQRQQVMFNLLDEAHTATLELPTEQRLPILQEICGVAFALSEPIPSYRLERLKGKFVSPPPLGSEANKRLKRWAEELYAIADELAPGSYARLQAQIAATRAMAAVDAKRSLEMLDELQGPENDTAEQQRSMASMAVFNALYRSGGEKVVADLRARAQTMGEVGQYPYDAMAEIAAQVNNRELAQAIFNDAIASFQRSRDRLLSMFEMSGMLRNDVVRNKLAPSQVREASMAIANQLKTEIDREQRALDEGKTGRPGLTIIVENIRAELKDVDPDLAASIPKVPVAKPAPAKQTVGDSAPPRTPADPEVTKAREAFDKISTRLMELSEDEVHSGAELQQVIERGIGRGTELAHLSVSASRDHTSALESAMAPVSDFVQVGARTNPAMTLSAVRKVQDAEIRARMLLTILQGLPDPRSEN